MALELTGPLDTEVKGLQGPEPLNQPVDEPANAKRKSWTRDNTPVVVPPPERQLILRRYEWYRDRFRASMALNMVLAVALCASLAGVAFLFLTRPAPVYFATTSSGSLIRLVPLNQPNMSKESVLQWAVDAFNAANDLNFANYRTGLQRACTGYFTTDGCAAYIKALENTGNLDAMKKRKLVLSGQVVDGPIILRHGISNGVYFWLVQLAGIVSYQNIEKMNSQRQLITLRIERVSTLDNDRGLGISQYISEPARVDQ